MAHELYIIEGKAYLIDTSVFKDLLNVPIVTVPEPPKELYFYNSIDFGPVVAPMSAIVVGAIDIGPEPEDRFFFLFPLGKKGYVRR